MEDSEAKFNIDSGLYLIVVRGISNNPNDYIDIINNHMVTKINGEYIYHYNPSLIFISENHQNIKLKPSQSYKYEQNNVINKSECIIINSPSNKKPVRTDDDFKIIILCFIISIILLKISKQNYKAQD